MTFSVARVWTLFESLFANLADDADEMNHRVRTVHRARKRSRVQHVALQNFDRVLRGDFRDNRRNAIAHQQPGLVARGVKLPHDFLPHESRSACDEYFHEFTIYKSIRPTGRLPARKSYIVYRNLSQLRQFATGQLNQRLDRRAVEFKPAACRLEQFGQRTRAAQCQ